MTAGNAVRAMLALAALAMAWACKGGQGNDQAEETYVVKVDTARAEGLGEVLQLPGKLVAASEADVSFKVPGVLKAVYVKEGDAVRAGQVLAELDATDYEVQLKATEAEYAHVKADAERVMSLYKDGGTTASAYDKARYGLQQMEAKLEGHRNQVGYTKLRAPYSGVVQRLYFDGRETVAAGMPVVSVLQAGDLEVEVNLPASAYLHRDDFGAYSCALDILPGKRFGLRHVSTLPKANANQLYTMRLSMTEKAEGVAAGMSAWVSIEMRGEGEASVRVPSTSVLEEGDGCYVYVYDNVRATVSRRRVSVESLHTDGTAVVTGDVESGAIVVSSGVHRLNEGVKVKILDEGEML